LIAVQNYADPQIGRLNEPLQNAEKLRFVLTARYRFANRDVKHLRDPKRDDLVEALDVRIDLKWWRDAGASSRGLLACLALPAHQEGRGHALAQGRGSRQVRQPCNRIPRGRPSDLPGRVPVDSTLNTKRDSRGSFVYRIIRHVSGYNVWA
jgi:hypothetical protein